ncbi:MAG: hypothetical protein IJN02_00130 [Bacteroidales bacterium]|nr:hypothetical protein [Bacteroidales bacterium]
MTATLSPTTKKNAITGKNTLVGYKLASDTSGDYVTIPGVSVFTGLGGTVEDIDQTCIAEDTKRYLSGAWDGNEITITIHHYTGDTTQQALISAANSGSIISLCIQYQDESTAIMEVALKTATPQDPSISDTLKWDIVGKLNSKPTWTLAS